jgi:hypothetical protein
VCESGRQGLILLVSIIRLLVLGRRHPHAGLRAKSQYFRALRRFR